MHLLHTLASDLCGRTDFTSDILQGTPASTFTPGGSELVDKLRARLFLSFSDEMVIPLICSIIAFPSVTDLVAPDIVLGECYAAWRTNRRPLHYTSPDGSVIIKPPLVPPLSINPDPSEVWPTSVYTTFQKKTDMALEMRVYGAGVVEMSYGLFENIVAPDFSSSGTRLNFRFVNTPNFTAGIPCSVYLPWNRYPARAACEMAMQVGAGSLINRFGLAGVYEGAEGRDILRLAILTASMILSAREDK